MELPLIIGLIALLVAFGIVLAVRQRRQRITAIPVIAEPATAQPAAIDNENEPSPELILFPTDRPNEVFVLGSEEDTLGLGTVLARTPPQLSTYATRLHASASTARATAELSGRLVMVDAKTAAAISSNQMMKDGSGKMVAAVLRSDKKISSLTRITPVAGKLAQVTALTNALTAIALQAQLDRIEQKLETITQRVDDVAKEQLLQWNATTMGQQAAIQQVYRTAKAAGELTEDNWLQIVSLNSQIMTQLIGDRERFNDEVTRFEAATRIPNIKKRRIEIDRRADALFFAYSQLLESTRAWGQFSALRLWRFTITEDSSLETYRQELEKFIRESTETISPGGHRALEAARSISTTKPGFTDELGC